MLKQETIENAINNKNNLKLDKTNTGADNMNIKGVEVVEVENNKENNLKLEKTNTGAGNMKNTIDNKTNYDKMNVDELKKELAGALKIKKEQQNNPLLNKRALNSKIKTLKRFIFLKSIFNSSLSVDDIYNSFMNAYKTKLITKNILEKNIKELYFLRFERSLIDNKQNKVIPLTTINHGASQLHRAFIVETKNSIKLYSYNNLILDYKLNTKNNTLWVATNTISTPNSPYDLKGSYSTSTNYNSFDKETNSINLTLLLSVTTTQHINKFLEYIKELQQFKKSNKGATAFIRGLTDNLTKDEFKTMKKTTDKNKLVKLASYNNKDGRWSFEQYKE